MPRLILSALLALALAAPARAQPVDERAAVLAAAQALFDALAAKDRDAIMALVVPEGRITAHVVRDGRAIVRTGSWEEWAQRIAAATERLEERMHDPEVRIRGSLATVWTEYSFHRDGAFSHCGIDLFDLARIDGSWRVVNISFTVETERCSRR